MRSVNTEYLRSAPTSSEGLNVRVDRKAGIIRGFAVMREGVTHDERYSIDTITLEQTRDFISAKDVGMKSRFTHPNLSNDGLGRRIGAVRNPRIDGEVLRGDLHLSDLAKRSPVGGDMHEHVLGLAEEAPDDFGASIAYCEDTEAMAEANLKRGNVPPLLRIKKLRAVDIVDEPAATDGFFSELAELPDSAARKASGVLDQYFGALDNDEIIERGVGFLNKYVANRGGEVFTKIEVSKMSNEPNSNDPPAEPVTTPTTPSSGDPALAAATPPVTPPATPAAAPATPEFVAALSAEDRAEEIRTSVADAMAAERKRGRDVTALCSKAGMPECADEFVAEGLSISDVKIALLDKQLERAGTPGVGADPAGDTKTVEQEALSEAGKNADALEILGVTPKEYARTVAAGIEGEVPVFKTEPAAA